MILQIKNVAEHNQPITLHTGEAKTIESGMAIKVNTGTDRRLINFYASLINYQFEVTAAEASGQEMNSFEDAIYRLKLMKEQADKSRVLKDKVVYSSPSAPYKEGEVEPRKPYNPKTLDETEASQSDAIKRVQTPEVRPQTVVQPAVPVPETPVVMDTKLGEVVPDYSPAIPEDYPDAPGAEAELAKLDQQEKEAQAESDSTNKKYEALDALSEDTLKNILKDKFDESTKLRSKWKIINHIIELADETEIDVFSLVDEYNK